ncbi:MAG TPA: TetR/AcrR family transcriptional regulator [Trebonia sp.]|nr:TetR/AcrR family transcriptional regulator [Trebonia sp.]
MAGLRKAQKEMTRRLLLSTALDLFQEKGYAATTIDEIAATAGTTRVTFYAYFPSRVDLMKAVIDELNELLGRTASPTHGSTAASLVEVVEDGSPDRIAEWLRRTSQSWDAIRPCTRAAFEAAAVDPEIRAMVEAWLDEAIGDIEEGLDRAGRFAPESRRLRGVLAITQLDHLARNWTEGRWNADRESMLEALTTSWVALTSKAQPQH